MSRWSSDDPNPRRALEGVGVSFERKYAGLDLKMVEAALINDPKECTWLMEQLDIIIADIDAKIGAVKAKAFRGEYSDPTWFRSVQRALKGAKATRQAVQTRKGELSREMKKTNQGRIEREFMDAAMKILPKETVSKIFDQVELNRRRMELEQTYMQGSGMRPEGP
jgi:hypothetical protein